MSSPTYAVTIKTVEVAESKLSERKRQSLPPLYPSNNDVKGKKLYSTNVKSHRSASTAGGRKITKSRKPLRDQTNDNGSNVQTRKNESSIACKRSSQKDTLKPKALLMGLSNEATCSKKKTCTYFTCLVFVLSSRADSNNVLSY
jgi:hypothetical protein